MIRTPDENKAIADAAAAYVAARQAHPTDSKKTLPFYLKLEAAVEAALPPAPRDLTPQQRRAAHEAAASRLPYADIE